MPQPATCSATSLAVGEPLLGTAPEARGWILVEQAGAWGRKALTESALDPAVGAELDARAKALGLKALLIKPPGRAPSRGRSVVLVSSLPGAEFIEKLELAAPADLLEIDLARLAAGEPTEPGDVSSSPLYLVCTNGRRDQCCATLGRAVARALAAERPGRVWECSHLGGHRFAANVVCLPDGLCYGRVTPERASELVDAHERRAIVGDLLRGRSALAPEAQAAEYFLLERGHLADGDSARAAETRGATVVFVTASGRTFEVEVARVAGPLRPASCDAEPEPSDRFELISLAER